MKLQLSHNKYLNFITIILFVYVASCSTQNPVNQPDDLEINATQVKLANNNARNNYTLTGDDTVVIKKEQIAFTPINQAMLDSSGVLSMIIEVKDLKGLNGRTQEKYFDELLKDFIETMRINGYTTAYMYTSTIEDKDRMGNNGGNLYMQAQNVGLMKSTFSKFSIPTIQLQNDKVSYLFIVLIAGVAPAKKPASFYNIPNDKITTNQPLPKYVIVNQLPGREATVSLPPLKNPPVSQAQ